jgi:sn-glycerol 3-phosphate transport system permease protein
MQMDVTAFLISIIPLLVGALYIGWIMRRMSRSPLIGAIIGGAAGLAGSRLLMIPLNNCTFDPEAELIDQYFGIFLVAVGAAVALGITQWVVRVVFSGRGWAALTADQSTAGTFRGWLMPWLLLSPTLIVLALFLYYPALDNFRLSTLLARLGTSRTAFVCVDNFTRLLEPEGFTLETLLLVGGVILIYAVARLIRGGDWWTLLVKYGLMIAGLYLIVGVILARVLASDYYRVVNVTFGVSLAIVVLSLTISLAIAYVAYQPVRGANIYRTLLIWPYAISPVVAGIIFALLFNPTAGIINHVIESLGGEGLPWLQDSSLAPWTIILASVWKSLGFSILFYIAGLQNVPKDLVEAAAIDGANAWQRFVNVIIPMLSPITFFLVITNITYAFFDIFGTIDFLTRGGPAGATSVMIYRIYDTGIVKVDLGKAAAESIVLFALVIGITYLQFRTSERRVTYGA